MVDARTLLSDVAELDARVNRKDMIRRFDIMQEDLMLDKDFQNYLRGEFVISGSKCTDCGKSADFSDVRCVTDLGLGTLSFYCPPCFRKRDIPGGPDG